MKRNAIGWCGILSIGAVLACIALQGTNFCAGQTAATPKAAIAAPAGAAGGAPAAAPGARGPNERFYAIQQVLDSGGSFYLYADTKDVLKQYVTNLQTILGNPDLPPQVAMGAVMANQAIDRLGLYGIQDVGVSTVPDGDLNRTKIFVSSSEGRTKGFLSLMGGDPHPIKLLDRVPADTELFFSADMDAQAAWALVRQVVLDVAGAAGQAQMDQGLAQLNAQTGIDVATVISSLGGEVAIVGSQNPAEKMTLPTGGPALSVDSPRIALMVRVTKDDLYQGLKQALVKQGAAAAGAEETEGKLRYIPIMAKPNPVWPTTPVLATDGEYVYFATHLDYMKTLAAGAGPGLRTSEEFKQLSTGLPTEANGCTFVSKRLEKAVLDALQAAAGQAGAGGGNPTVGLPGQGGRGGDMTREGLSMMLMNQAIAKQGPPSGSLALRINRPDGILIVNRSKGNAASVVPALAIAPVAVLAAIAVPNFLEAQTRAKVARVQSDMRSLATAIESFAVDQKKYPPSSPDAAQNLFGAAAVQRNPALKQVSTFQLVTMKDLGMGGNPAGPNVGVAAPGSEPLLMPLTTPVSYITSIPSDVFASGAPAEKTPFCYYSTPDNKWILWSAGPDGQYDVTTEDLTRVFSASTADPLGVLAAGVGTLGRAFTYDPSNGTTSAGDVWKIGGNVAASAPPVRPAGPAPVGLPGGMR